jgi:hypothetical protein
MIPLMKKALFLIILIIFANFLLFLANLYLEKERERGIERALQRNQEILGWWNNLSTAAFANGTEVYIRDQEIEIEIRPSKIVYVKDYIRIIDEKVAASTAFAYIAWKFTCFTYPKADGTTITICPENATEIDKISFEVRKEELKLHEREVKFVAGIGYLLIDNQTGELISHRVRTVPTRDELVEMATLDINNIFDIREFKAATELEVDFTHIHTPRCIKFPIPRYSDLRIKVTMLSPISNFSFGRPEFIREVYTVGNSIIVRIRPYPCCGIARVSQQAAEICSI